MLLCNGSLKPELVAPLLYELRLVGVQLLPVPPPPGSLHEQMLVGGVSLASTLRRFTSPTVCECTGYLVARRLPVFHLQWVAASIQARRVQVRDGAGRRVLAAWGAGSPCARQRCRQPGAGVFLQLRCPSNQLAAAAVPTNPGPGRRPPAFRSGRGPAGPLQGPPHCRVQRPAGKPGQGCAGGRWAAAAALAGLQPAAGAARAVRGGCRPTTLCARCGSRPPPCLALRRPARSRPHPLPPPPPSLPTAQGPR